MVLSLRCTKSLIQRIETQNKKGYTIKRKTTRRKPAVLPVNKVPEQGVTDKVPRKETPPQIETTVHKDPTDQAFFQKEPHNLALVEFQSVVIPPSLKNFANQKTCQMAAFNSSI